MIYLTCHETAQQIKVVKPYTTVSDLALCTEKQCSLSIHQGELASHLVSLTMMRKIAEKAVSSRSCSDSPLTNRVSLPSATGAGDEDWRNDG